MIKKIIYCEIPKDVCTPEKAASSYWNYSMMDVLPEDGLRQFEEFEIGQMHMKNQALSDEMKRFPDSHPDADRSIIALSSMRDEVVVLCELRGES
jgi:hypothetical protein